MNNLSRLKQLEKPIRVGIIGIGSMGKGLLFQISQTPGINCVACFDLDNGKSKQALTEFGLRYREVKTSNDFNHTLDDNLLALTEDPNILLECERIDVFIEATNTIIEGCEYVLKALHHGKHTVLMNSEIDQIFGPYLLQVAKQNNVQITSCDGDQHVVIMHLIDKVILWGFELIMAGNIKGYLNRYANPTSIIPEADKRNLDYKMCTAYTDGSKLNLEMSLIANACDLRATSVGMTGPKARQLEEVFQLFDFKKIKNDNQPVIDYIEGSSPHGGVFVVGYSDNNYQQKMMKYYKMGNGPFYIFYRPYHLCHIESVDCIASLYLDQLPFLIPLYGFKTQVYSYAKTDLKPGDLLDGIGGYKAYGMVENYEPDNPGIPICLSEGLHVKSFISKDRKIQIQDIESPKKRRDFQLFELALKYGHETRDTGRLSMHRRS